MAKDVFHDVVRDGLESEGWTITDDPYRIELDKVNFQVDLAAEKIIAAQKNNQKIAVEIKSFLNPSAVTDFYGALGQFLSYRLVLKTIEPQRILFLAIPLDAYEEFFQSTFAQLAINEYQLKLIIYDSEKGGLTQWIN
ncbi:MAG: element excision factor XisH family protein [Xenococcaceae cyanobacterium MO_234.B1]|nr:element excision factor XisH family protein [Xenococcaceae cyanobacterium MO_234.B1]